MIAKLVELSLVQRALVCALGLLLLFGGLYAFHILDVVAYPDPSPPFVEVISQKAGWSAEEMERIITIPIETALQGIPGLTNVRSLSLFGLSELKVYFEFGTNWYAVRQEVLNRLHTVDLPEGVKPELSPWWAIAEIYRYELVGENYSLTDLKTIQDWQVRREFKRVPGIIDVTAFGGTTKEYHVDLDPGALITYDVTVPQITAALANSNANVGGSYLALGPQSYNVRGVGFIDSLEDVANTVVAVKDGTPIFVKNLGKVSIGNAIRLGQVGINDMEDTVEGVILLQRDTQALPTLERVNQKIKELNSKKLPPGVEIKTIYDRTVMINTVIETVVHILINGMVLVLIVLLFFLGHFRTALIVACTIPLALLFTFSAMVLMGQSANLISLGAIDFGIIVDAPLVMVESIFYYLCHHAKPGVTPPQLIARASRHVGRPILFSTVIIVVAFIPLFTMTGVPGKIFAPMSITYGLALAGSLLLACTLAPAMCSFLLNGPMREKEPKLVSMLRQRYLASLRWGLHNQKLVLGAVGMLLLITVLALSFMGGEFMPALEEGNIWVRIRMPIDIRFDDAAALASRMRKMFMESPEVETAVSQLGRPDDGTDPESFFNVEYYVSLKPREAWRHGLTKEALIEEIEERLETIPGLKVNFSQLIQDSVEEAMSGVKSENSIKLYGHNLTELQALAEKVEGELKNIRGVKELSINRTMGQPNLLIQVDRQACARYGIQVADVNAMVQAAIGGEAVTQVIEGDRRFDLVVRFLPQYRQDENSIGQIQVSSPEGVGIPLKQLATIVRQTGAFMIYRENHERYIPIMFSIRDRDLVSTIQEAQRLLQEKIQLPEGYHLEWAGQYDQLVREQQRLMVVVPLTMVLILFLLYLTFGSFRYAFIVLTTVPFAMIGGVLSLVLTNTPFSISAAVGFISTLGIAILGGVLIVSSIRELEQKGTPLMEAILSGAELQMRPVLMATLGAALGLVPAAIASGIGSEAQKPLARVVVGGMLTATFLILFVVPILYHLTSRLTRFKGEPHSQSIEQEQSLGQDHSSVNE
ncbi:MAG: efflux RND transporter permease subunit [Nitrospirales bacterium]